MNINEYIQKVSSKPMWDLIITYAFADHMSNEINEKQFMQVLQEVDRLYFPKPEVTSYLSTVEQRATPDLVKQAKKTVKTYMEQLIYKDEKQAVITPEMAKQAKEMIPAFLNKIRPDMNQK